MRRGLGQRVARAIERRNLPRRLHWFVQRQLRGFDDTAVWNLDHTLARVILPYLEAKRYPPPTAYPSGVESSAAWLAILDEMIFAFRHYARDDYFDHDISADDWQRVRRGLKLFGKWYPHL